MALKKIKPLSPNIYLGHTVGDNELARLGHVNDIVSKFRKVHEFEVPALGDTIRIIPNHVETIVTFKAPLTHNFTIEVLIDPRLSVNLGPGDRMYIFLEGGGISGNANVTFTGAIEIAQCGDTDNTYRTGDPICFEVIYNGTQFIGIDNC
jgi:hypothetical protein